MYACLNVSCMCQLCVCVYVCQLLPSAALNWIFQAAQKPETLDEEQCTQAFESGEMISLLTVRCSESPYFALSLSWNL